jgi:hypothetical protein
VIALGDDENPRPLCHRLDDLAGEAEDGRLIGRAVADSERASRHRFATSPGRNPKVAKHNTIARSRRPHGVEAPSDASSNASCASLR